MMQEEHEQLETLLRQIPPATPPPDLMERLRVATAETPPVKRRAAGQIHRTFHWTGLFAGWRGLAVAVPASAMIVLAWLGLRLATVPDEARAAAVSGIKANAVQVDHSLVASFDTVAQLPGGVPVRFRCREWQDDVVIHDDTHGVVISKSTPRVEVMPVRFETY